MIATGAPEPAVATAVALVLGGDEFADALVGAVEHALGHRVDVRRVADVDAAATLAASVAEQGGIVPLAIVVFDPDDDPAPGTLGGAAVNAARAAPSLAATRLVLATKHTSLRNIDHLLRNNAVNGMISRPWTTDGIRKVATAHLATYLVEHAPERLDDFRDLLSEEHLSEAVRRIELRRHASDLDTQDGDGGRHPLLDTSAEDEQWEVELVQALDRALGHPPRIRVAPGTTLIEAGEDVGGIYVLLEGAVKLTSITPGGEQVLHEQSTGSILGLLSLATHRRAMLQCKAVTEVRAIPITLDQLAHAFDVEPSIARVLNRVLIGSLARRLRRSDELQVELDQSLAALREARAELVSAAQLATLGELSAGLAHELNNPVAALVRAVDGVTSQLISGGLLDPDDVSIVAERLDATVPSTAEQRALRRTLTDVVGDRRLAERLLAAGITDPDTAQRAAASGEAQLARLEAAATIGNRLRDAGTAARRIEALVGSLRAYVRGDDGRGQFVDDVDVGRTVRSALRLLTHRSGNTDVELHLNAEPTVQGRPGELQAVWSNLVANALDALDRHAAADPRIVVEVGQPDPDHVRVTVEDNGPGIAPETLEHIFEPRFTTKHGRVSFGLGLGLSISRQIVDEHGGTIAVDSAPGRTVFTVVLPCRHAAGDRDTAPDAKNRGATDG